METTATPEINRPRSCKCLAEMHDYYSFNVLLTSDDCNALQRQTTSTNTELMLASFFLIFFVKSSKVFLNFEPYTVTKY